MPVTLRRAGPRERRTADRPRLACASPAYGLSHRLFSEVKRPGSMPAVETHSSGILPRRCCCGTRYSGTRSRRAVVHPDHVIAGCCGDRVVVEVDVAGVGGDEEDVFSVKLGFGEGLPVVVHDDVVADGDKIGQEPVADSPRPTATPRRCWPPGSCSRRRSCWRCRSRWRRCRVPRITLCRAVVWMPQSS